MKKIIVASVLALILARGAQAQNTNLTFIPGKLVVYRGGDGMITITKGRQHPAFLDEYDPVTNNQANPIMSFELPTNGSSSLWLNAHAGSEGQGFTRSADRQYLVMTGYHGDLNSIPGTPSSATNSLGQGYPRGFGLIDAFTNYNLTYASADWFGLQPGLTQNNPRGVATDGSNNFWGTGTLAGTQSGGFQESGTLFWNNTISPTPELVQSIVDSAYFLKIINGTLYMVAKDQAGGAQANGLYNFVDFANNGGALVPLPWAPGNVQHVVTTNLFLDFGSTYSGVLTFDMDPAGTTVYAADNTYGIVKFVNSGGTWTSPYVFGTNNLGTTNQPFGNGGCFGIAVDFSGVNPIIYATTMEEGDGANVCSNRLISIVDTGDPGTNVVATTLAVAQGINEVFRGVAFAPELLPAITFQPVSVDTTTNVSASFTVTASSIYPLSYQWQQDGTNIANDANIAGANTNTLVFLHSFLTNQGDYTVIITNQYGAVTSEVATLDVSAVAVLPSLTNAVEYLTNYVGNNASFSVNPSGTPEFEFQWYFGATQLQDDGLKYNGSTGSTLYITNLQILDSGSYFVTISNAAGGISNLVAVLTVQYVLPNIPPDGQPASITVLQGQTNSLSVSSVEGTPPLSYQWYEGILSSATQLMDENEFSGTATNTLTISGATLSDDASYFCIVSNAGGSQTSEVATVTVIVPPALSFVAYSNQVYTQNFDSLPDPGSNAVNTVSGGGPVTIGGITYSVANPFDFAYPLYTNITDGDSGGLNLAATMPGWYGESDADAQGAQLGASDGSQTTGGVISFGTLDSDNGDRALGLIATGSSGDTHFGLKLINETAANLNYINLQFVGEYWKLGTHPKTLSFGYFIDPAGNASTLSRGEIASAQANPVSSLSFSFPTAPQVGPTNGLLAVNQTNLGVNELALSAPWPPGSALWLVWSLNDPTGSGQGYGVDNLSFSAVSSTNLVVVTAPTLGDVAFAAGTGLSFSFTNTPEASGAFTVRVTTNLALPFSQWQNLGHPNEVSAGDYQFTDSQTTNQPQKFYSITSP